MIAIVLLIQVFPRNIKLLNTEQFMALIISREQLWERLAVIWRANM